MNVPLHIEHWCKGAEEALSFAEETVERGRVQFGLFFAHLALEKALKAHVVSVTGETPPFIHNLVKLAELTQLEFTRDQIKFLGEMTGWNLSGRYTEFLPKAPGKEEHRRLINEMKGLCRWLIQRL